MGLAQALVGNPKTLILDEPTVGLDPKQIIEIRSLIRKLGKNHTVILSSHILSEVQAVCDKIVVINQGKIVANDTEENLSQKLSGDHTLSVTIEGDTQQITRMLQTLEGVSKVHFAGEHKNGSADFRIETKEDCDIRKELFTKTVENGWYILEMKSSELNLEDIFLRLTMGEDITALTEKGDNK